MSSSAVAIKVNGTDDPRSAESQDETTALLRDEDNGNKANASKYKLNFLKHALC